MKIHALDVMHEDCKRPIRRLRYDDLQPQVVRPLKPSRDGDASKWWKSNRQTHCGFHMKLFVLDSTGAITTATSKAVARESVIALDRVACDRSAERVPADDACPCSAGLWISATSRTRISIRARVRNCRARFRF